MMQNPQLDQKSSPAFPSWTCPFLPVSISWTAQVMLNAPQQPGGSKFYTLPCEFITGGSNLSSLSSQRSGVSGITQTMVSLGVVSLCLWIGTVPKGLYVPTQIGGKIPSSWELGRGNSEAFSSSGVPMTWDWVVMCLGACLPVASN